MVEETTIRIPKDARERLTVFLGELMTQTREMLKLGDAVRTLLETGIILPKDLVVEIVHIVYIGSFSSEIFSAITGLIGTIVGVLLTSKG